ncbi:MAG: peptidase M16 [Proteobacteria bacterium]|nr:peptidase M16 [Pseudomonadota bacterium]
MTVDKTNHEFKVGKVIEGFRVERIEPLPKLNNIMYQLEHEATGASLIHLSNDDDNNCFSAILPTTPTDSTGVAHILEHTALCGSKLYPVRDPFFSMIRRSMKTFMNAMTAGDWTMYPFASQNETDFYNLMSVYLDAVFFPILSEQSFQQEGHRLEFENENDLDSPLVVQGIVYSEMMGAMSSQSHLMHRNLGQALFPTITYRYNSGGDPADISKLSYRQLLDFHKSHYHPSNALFFTYGDIALNKHLKVINRSILSKFDKIDIDTSVPDEQRYSSSKESTFHYPLHESEDDGEKCQIALAWLTCNIKEPLEILSLQVVNLILLGHSGAPLRKKLLESKLGKSMADTTGFEDEIREPYFSVGLQAVAEKNVDKVEALILNTLAEVAEKGVTSDQIESAIHQIEFDTREISGGHYPYSLNLLFRFLGTWVHGGDPFTAIDFDRTIEQLKTKIQEGPYLENQIRKYLIENPHRVKVVLKPDTNLEKKNNEELKKELEAVKSKFGPEEKENIVQAAKNLKKLQETDEDLSCLPSLKVSDIPEGVKYIEPHLKGMDGLDVAFYDRPTNGILYFSWHFEIDEISEEDREWLPVLGYLLTGTGAGGLSYEEMAERTSRYTGGFSAAPSIEATIGGQNGYHEFFSVSSKALNRNLDKMFELGELMIGQWDFTDLNRIQTLIAQRTNNMVNSIVQLGHNYASSLASRRFSRSNQIDEIYSGIHQIHFMKKLVRMDPAELEESLQRLNRILQRIFRKEQPSMLVIGEKEVFDTTKRLISNFVDNIKDNTSIPTFEESPTNRLTEAEDFQIGYQNEAWLTTTPVSYVAKCFKTADFSHEDSPALLVLTNLVRSCYLHGEIREKGGAYGGMAGYNTDEGILSLLSYRDPHLARTISIYQDTLSWLKNGSFSDLDVDETILQTCSNMDTPMSPAGKAMMNYISDRKGKTRELREYFRAGVLKCTRDDLIRVGSKYLDSRPSLAAITSEEIVKRDESSMKDRPLETQSI